MRISHKHKFIWISKPKTGSTSVRKLLDRFSNVVSTDERPLHHHATADELRAAFAERGWNFDDYQVFICDRNPWELIGSVWKYSKFNQQRRPFWHPRYDASLPLLSFGEFMRSPNVWRWVREHHALDRFAGAQPWPANLHVYDIGSQAQQLVDDLSRHIGKPIGELPVANASQYDPADLKAFAEVFADPKIDAEVRKAFKTSIERFGYTNPFTPA